MNDNKRFDLGKAPFIRKADHSAASTSTFMMDFMIALAPLIIFAWIKNGILPYVAKDTNFLGMIYPLLLVLIGGGFSFLLEFLWYKFIIKTEPVKVQLKKSYPFIPGLLLGMIVPLATPIWVLLFGVFFATVIAKLMFGGFGNNVFNPALVGYLFLTYAYFGQMTSVNESINAFGYLNGSERIIAGATPMATFAADRIGAVPTLIDKYGLLKMFVGLTPGSLSETSALLCLIALIYLLVRRVINWRIPVIYLGTVFVLTYIIGAFNGYAGTLDYALFGILNGGLMFGAVFMATEPVTSPRNPNGKVLYALGLGVLTVVFRFASSSPEGVATSILVMNMFTAIIERLSSRLRVESNKRKVVLTYSLIGLLFLGISAFPVVKSIPVTPEITYTEKAQDFKTLNFVYKFTIKDEEVLVITDQTNKILSVSNQDYNTEDYKAEFKTLIDQNKIKVYLTKTIETADNLKVFVNSRGYKSFITNIITFNNNNKMIEFTSDTSEESYGDEYNALWSDANGHPKDIVPGKIMEDETDFEKIKVTGATITSKAIFDAGKLANEYLAYLQNIQTLTLVGRSQDYETLGFIYVFRDANGKHIVNTNQDNVITSEVEASIKTEVENLISNNHVEEFIESANESEIVVVIKGFKGFFKTTITYDENYKITQVIPDTSKESFTDKDNERWKKEYGRPEDVLPGKIIESQPVLDEEQIKVTGATVTSKAIVRASKLALEYLQYKEANHE